MLAILVSLATLMQTSDQEPVQGRVRLLLEIPGLSGHPGPAAAPVPLGDIDGDGVPDVARATGGDAFGEPFEAEVVRPGLPADWHAQLAGQVAAHSGKDGRQLWRVVGRHRDELGAAAAAIGDVDGDGILDLAVGAPQSAKIRTVRQPGGQEPLLEMRAPGYVLFVSGVDGTVLRLVGGPMPGSRFGHALAPVGDLDRDGCPDVAVGAPSDGPAGSARILSGRTGLVLRVFVGSVEKGGFGAQLGGGGDLDGDAVPDLLVRGADGRVHALSGATGNELTTLDPLGDEWGCAGLAICDDVDGDGRSEILVGRLFDDCPNQEPTCRWTSGWRVRARLLSGADGTTIRTWDEPELFSSVTELGRAALGRVAFVGDVDGDGVQDVALGAMESFFAHPHTLAVFSGEDGGLLAAWCDGGDDRWCRADRLAGVGDIDGDGREDLAVSVATDDAIRIYAID